MKKEFIIRVKNKIIDGKVYFEGYVKNLKSGNIFYTGIARLNSIDALQDINKDFKNNSYANYSALEKLSK